MRTIKFRGKRIDNGHWVYGHYFQAPLTDENSGMPSESGWFFLSGNGRFHCIGQDGVSFVIDPETLGQFTGLHDKNAKEIYEGDILEVEEISISENGEQKQLRGADVVQATRVGFVEWDAEGCDYNLICDSEEEVIGIPRHEQKYEVLGNTHDQLGLLNV